MTISTRTPGGEPFRCPVCGSAEAIEPSVPPGDAPCPRCGHLVWFRRVASDGVPALRILVDQLQEGTFEALKAVLKDRGDAMPEVPVVLDFSEVRWLSTASVAGLVALKRALGRVRLVLRRVHPDLREVFRITRLDQVFLDIEP